MRSLKYIETNNKKLLEMKTGELLSYSGDIKLLKVKDKTINDTLSSFKMIKELQKNMVNQFAIDI